MTPTDGAVKDLAERVVSGDDSVSRTEARCMARALLAAEEVITTFRDNIKSREQMIALTKYRKLLEPKP